MARKFQTYARPSTTNAATERRGYNFLYVEFPMFYQKKFGHYDNFAIRRQHNLGGNPNANLPCVQGRGRDAKRSFDFAQDDN